MTRRQLQEAYQEERTTERERERERKKKEREREREIETETGFKRICCFILPLTE